MEQGNKTSNATVHTSQTRVGNAISCCAGCACRMAGAQESGDGATLLTKCGENMAVRVNDGSWVIHFGVFEADLRAGELRRNGLKVKLQEQPFQILAMLLKRPGEIVTREEVRARLWSADTFVDFDHGLNSAIQRLRDALGDSAENPGFVETVARRGYRFIAPVASRVLLARRHEAIDSVAVLPFANDSGDPNTEYLSDGITDSLINNLSQISTLRVIARSTMFRYKGKDADPQRAGCDLHVCAVVSGRLLQRGSSLIVQAELMDVATGSQLWGGQYNRETEDVFVLQDDLSSKISEKLRLRLTGDEKQRLTKRYTEDAEAYRFYQKGRYHWNKRTPEGVKKAIEYFHQALDKDPAYSLAYAGLADTYAYLSFFHVVPPREAMPKAKTAAAKALEIDDHLAEAHVALGYVSFTYDGDWPAAGKHFEEALALNPAYSRAHTFYPFYLSSLGRSEEALAVARRALDFDPASPAVSHSLAVQLYFARQFDQAINQAHNTLELDANFAISYALLGEVFVSKGMYREGLLALEKYSALSRSSATSLALLGYSHARLGERSQALRMIEELQTASKQNFVPAFFFALVYAGLEDKDRAFTWLEKAYEERSNRLAYLKVEALWDPLRSDSRFADLLRRVGIPH
jgi:TolB-like protein/Tfp pilus assembly protein PilF